MSPSLPSSSSHSLQPLTDKSPRRYWTNKEQAVIREHYPNGDAEACAPHLPGRTPCAIRRQANKMGVRSARLWSEAEEQVLRDHYEAGGVAACAPHLPGRSAQAISAKAADMGLDASRDWSDVEKKVLRRHFEKRGARDCMALLPGRTLSAVRRMALNMRLKDPTGHWGADEEQVLRDHYATRGPAYCVKLLKARAVTAVRAKAGELGLKAPKHNAKGADLGGVRTLNGLKDRCHVTDGGHWDWRGAMSHGRGTVWLPLGPHNTTRARTELVQRAALILDGKDITGLVVSDGCDFKGCCNPKHVWSGTKQESRERAKEAGAFITMPKKVATLRMGAKRRAVAQETIAELKSQGLKDKEIAAEVGVSASAVWAGRRRAKEHQVVPQASPFALGRAIARGLVSAEC